MKISIIPLPFLFFSPLILADEINAALQQNKQQRTEVQQQNQQRWFSQHQYQQIHNQENFTFSQACLPYRGLMLRGVTLIDPQSILPKIGECLTEARLNQFSRDLTQSYIEKGYMHNPFQFSEQGGFLIAEISEGKLAALESNDETLPLNQLLPNALNKALRVQDLDQALDQANKVTGNQVSVDVLPAQNGEMKLVFDNARGNRISGVVGIDNYSSKTYGRTQARTSLSIGNPFGIGDNLYFSGAHTLKSTKQFSRSALIHYSIPYGYWTFSGFTSFSQFKMPLFLQSLALQQKGRTWQGGITADYAIHRGTNHISTLSAQVENINSKNQLEDVVLELQSPKLTTWALGFNHLQLFENASLVADLHYEKGRNRAENQPSEHFRRWNMELRFNRYQSLGGQLFRHTHQLTGQYTRNYLPAVKQEDLTGRYRVRGLNDLNISAEKNLVLQNNLAWIKQTEFGTFSPYIGIDGGIQTSIQDNAHNEKTWAYAVGINWDHRLWQSNIEWARGRFYQKARSISQENLLSFNLGYKF